MHTETLTGPAVTFDPEALRVWLAKADDSAELDGDGAPYTRADDLGVDGDDFSRGAGGNVLVGLDGLMQALREDDEQTAWVLGDGVDDVSCVRTIGGDGADGAIVIVDLDNRIRLASLPQDFKQFASTEQHGVDAADAALGNLAQQANTITARYHRRAG